MRKRYKKLWHHYSTPEEVRQQGIETERYYATHSWKWSDWFGWKGEKAWRRAKRQIEESEIRLKQKYWPR